MGHGRKSVDGDVCEQVLGKPTSETPFERSLFDELLDSHHDVCTGYDLSKAPKEVLEDPFAKLFRGLDLFCENDKLRVKYFTNTACNGNPFISAVLKSGKCAAIAMNLDRSEWDGPTDYYFYVEADGDWSC